MVPPRVLEKAGKARNFSPGTGNGGVDTGTIHDYIPVYMHGPDTSELPPLFVPVVVLPAGRGKEG